MKIKIKLAKDWKEHKSGTVIEIEESIGKTLIETGYAELIATKQTIEEQLEAAVMELKTKAKGAFVDAVTEAVNELQVKGAGGQDVHVQFVKERVHDDPTGGFVNFGEFAKAVVAKDCGKGMDEKLKVYMTSPLVQKAASGMNEGVGEEGGLLIPEQMSTSIWTRASVTNDLLSRVMTIPVSSNTYTILAEKGDTKAAGIRNAGVRGYWVEEAGQLTGSKPLFERRTMRLKKLGVMVYATDEQISDSPMSLDVWLTQKAGDEIGFMLGDAIINGNGVGQPLGLLNSACLISVAKEADQGADTILTENIVKMYSRMYAPSRNNAVWNINQDCEPQLLMLSVNVGTGGVPLMFPAGGFNQTPYSQMLGKPVMPTEWNPTVGDTGDILLADWSQYMMITKGGIKSAVSIHLRFDYDETVFKFTYRCDGMPQWSAPLTPYKGGNTQSPFVKLNAR